MDEKIMKKQHTIYLNAAFSLSTLLSISIAYAGDQVGMLTQIDGAVKIFSHPSKTLQKKDDHGKPHALFEGEYFQVSDAKIGDKVDKGNIVRTAPGAKARVVYPNGDQINVGPATAYRVSWDEDSTKGKTQVSLAYGKLRGVIEKGGPRSRLQIRTKSAVMGVRGTDFFIAQGGEDQATEVSILRGEVEVTPQVPKAKPIPVKAGFSAEIPKVEENVKTSTHATAVPQVELRKTTQEDLHGIQKSSTIAPKAREVASAQADPETKKAIEKLEKKATTTVLNDIKTHDPKMYEALTKNPTKPLTDVDQINQASIQTLIKAAPKAPEKHKPYKSEVEDLGAGAYEDYFKIID
jgi:hypothetical protein